jgi:hypothetical protein
VLLLISVYRCQLQIKTSISNIYNIVTGSVAVNLEEKFKSEVTKAAQQLKSAGSKGVSRFRIKCSVISFGY